VLFERWDVVKLSGCLVFSFAAFLCSVERWVSVYMSFGLVFI